VETVGAEGQAELVERVRAALGGIYAVERDSSFPAS